MNSLKNATILQFFFCEQRSKVLKRSFFVLVFIVVLVVGVELILKNVPNRTKIVQGNKKCAREQKISKGTKNVQGNKKCAREQKNVLLWHIMVLNCRVCPVWPCVVLYGLMWPHFVLLLFTAMVMCGLIRLSMALCDLVWSCMAFLCSHRAFYGLSWQNSLFSRS